MGFSSGDVETMAYDFTTALQGVEGWDGVPLADTIPEPTVEQIDAYNDFWLSQYEDQGAGLMELDSLRAAAKGGDSTAAAALLTATLEQRRALSTGKLLPAQMDAIAALCSNNPPARMLHALPARVQSAFRDYVMGELIDAPKEKPGT